MKRLKMPELTAVLPGPLKKTVIIPGGWEARIPVAEKFDTETMKAYGSFFQSQGWAKKRAREEVTERMQTVFEASWVRYLGTSVRYWARKYAKRYPRNLNEDGTLRGFRPELLQNTYIPKVNTGRRGKVYVSELFQKMNEEGENE